MSLFSPNSILYKVSEVLYNVLILNLLWIIFSIPIFTIGASNTAIFYVVGKIIRGENINSIFFSFWKSFKYNFKKATIIWLLILLILFILFINMTNLSLFGKFSILILIIQIFILLELIIIYIYIFPLLSRYHLTVLNAFKGALFIGNHNLLTTILSLAVFPGLYFIMTIHDIFLFGIISIYGFWISFLLRGKIERLKDFQNKNSKR